MITMNMFLFLCQTTIDLMLILLFMNNFKEFTEKTEIS